MRPNLKWQEALPRVIADLVVVHCSMIGALAVSVIYRVAVGSAIEAQQLIVAFESYYIRFFWLMSPIFPLTFAVHGFYSHTRGYSGRRKRIVIMQGAAVAALLFLGANSVVWGSA